MTEISSVHQISANDIDGNPINFSKYDGNILLISNVASYCGLTKCSYKLFTELADKYYDKGLRILLIPCNQFGNQEPDNPETIKSFVKAFSPKLEVFEKMNVNGSNTHPLFSYLKKKCPGTLVNTVKWNFTKFVVDENGVGIKRFSPKDSNEDGEIEKLIQQQLSKLDKKKENL